MKKYPILILLFMIALIGNAQADETKGDTLAKASSAQSGQSDSAPSVETASEPVAKVKIFPNPATNVVNVLGLKNTSKADISVLDIYGNTVLNYQWAIRRNALNIPISTLESGAYILHIHSDGQQVRKKFYKK